MTNKHGLSQTASNGAAAGKGLFISFEGGEGGGKTTQARLLGDALTAEGHEVVLTREPGGTPDAEKIRNLLVQRDGGNWTPWTECLLLLAARETHVKQLIRPALDRGAIVLCDRFTDSTVAYQGYGHGVDLDRIEAATMLTLGRFTPHLTFILDLPVQAGLVRAGARLSGSGSSEDRFERLDIGFHERMRQGFLEIARRDADRCTVIDAARQVDAIAADVLSITRGRLSDVR